jgi:hypothetical protein
MSKRITPALIKEHVSPEAKIKRRLLGGYNVALPSGASVKITQSRIDFGKYKWKENRKDVWEYQFTSEVKGTMHLAKVAWGGLRTLGKMPDEDNAKALEVAEKLGVNTGDQGLCLRFYGSHAKIKYYRFGWRVTLPNGESVKVLGRSIEEVNGGAELFRTTLSLLNELAPGKVIVSGNQELILAGLQHADELEIDVIPEYYPMRFYQLLATVFQIVCILAAWTRLGLFQAILVGFFGGCLLWAPLVWVFKKAITNDARRRGQNLRSKWPSVHGGDRKADQDEAKRKGML